MYTYIVGALNTELEVEVSGSKQKIDLILQKGMLGFLPVFKKKKDAENYAGKKYKIYKFEVSIKKSTL